MFGCGGRIGSRWSTLYQAVLHCEGIRLGSPAFQLPHRSTLRAYPRSLTSGTNFSRTFLSFPKISHARDLPVPAGTGLHFQFTVCTSSCTYKLLRVRGRSGGSSVQVPFSVTCRLMSMATWQKTCELSRNEWGGPSLASHNEFSPCRIWPPRSRFGPGSQIRTPLFSHDYMWGKSSQKGQVR